jgi:hypothetical protein
MIALSITTNISSFEYKNDIKGFEVLIHVKNEGKDTAFNVFPFVQFNSCHSYLPRFTNLEYLKEATFKMIFYQPLLNLNYPGTYPVFIWINYQDSNGKAYSSIQVAKANHEDAGPAVPISINLASYDLKLSVENPIIDCSVTLINEGEITYCARYNSVASKELSINYSKTHFPLEGGDEGTVNLLIENISGLPGSTYVVYHIVQSLISDLHCFNATPQRIDII